MQTIASRHHPTLRAFRELADEPDPSGIRLLLDGVHLVRDAADAGLEFELVCVATSRLDRDSEAGALAVELERRGIEVAKVPDGQFTAASPVRTPSGLVAIARRRPVTLAQICGAPALLLMAVLDVQDPGNVGAIVRVAEAAGASGVIVAGASASPFSWKALRGGMGSTLRLPVVDGIAVPDMLASLRAHSVRLTATVPRGGGDPDRVDWKGRIALLLGGEGPGLSADTLRSVDEQVSIPMTPPVESLNVAVAAAVLLYAARRQRVEGAVSAPRSRTHA